MNKSYKTGKVLFIIALILFILITLIMSIEMINIYIQRNNEGYNLGLNVAAFLIIYVIILGAPIHFIVSILSFISMIKFRKIIKSNSNSSKNIKILRKSSILLTFLPPLVEIMFAVFCILLA